MRFDIEVFEVNARFADKGGEIVKKQGEADRSAFILSDQGFGKRMRAEKGPMDALPGGDDFMREMFEVGQFFYQGQYCAGIGFNSRSYIEC